MKKLNLPDKECLHCGETFGQESCKQIWDYKVKKFCSMKCGRQFHTGEKAWNWKGGIKTRPDGYIRDSKTDRYIHRIVMEKHLGRPLTREENIHHIDGNPKNNDISNLEIVTNSEHRKLEYKLAPKNKYGQFTKK